MPDSIAYRRVQRVAYGAALVGLMALPLSFLRFAIERQSWILFGLFAVSLVSQLIFVWRTNPLRKRLLQEPVDPQLLLDYDNEHFIEFLATGMADLNPNFRNLDDETLMITFGELVKLKKSVEAIGATLRTIIQPTDDRDEVIRKILEYVKSEEDVVRKDDDS